MRYIAPSTVNIVIYPVNEWVTLLIPKAKKNIAPTAKKTAPMAKISSLASAQEINANNNPTAYERIALNSNRSSRSFGLKTLCFLGG